MGRQRFREFLLEVAGNDEWRYKDGTPMQSDARGFLKSSAVKWVSVSEDVPDIEDFLTSRNVLFVCDDGEVYFGHYHSNGCFYSADYTGTGYTQKALHKYERHRLPDMEVLFWADLPESPIGGKNAT